MARIEAHARLAKLLAASGRIDGAALHYESALRGLRETKEVEEQERKRRRLQWTFELAAVESKRGERRKAVALYEEVLKEDEACVEAMVNMAAQLAIADARQLEEALELCDRALRLQPDFAVAHYNRNMLLRRLGRQREAVRDYWTRIKKDLGEEAVRESRPVPDELARAVVLLKGQNDVKATSQLAGKDGECGLNNQEAGVDDGVTVVCVKWGNKYGAEYVNKLYNAVMRHCGELTRPRLAFVCMTDISEGIQPHTNLYLVPLQDCWKGWWNKCQMFSSAFSDKLRGLGHSRCFYMDLDTVIVGSLAELLGWTPPPGVMTLLKTDGMTNEQRAGGYNSSIMVWRSEHDKDMASFRFLHDFLHAHFPTVNKYIYKFDHWLEMALPEVSFLEGVHPGQVVEYRSLDETAATPPPNASIVCFPLQPKPHNAEAPWVAQHWD